MYFQIVHASSLFRRLNCPNFYREEARFVLQRSYSDSTQTIVFCQLVRNTVRASLNSCNEVDAFEV